MARPDQNDDWRGKSVADADLKKNLPLHKTIFKKLPLLCFSQWCLIEYAAGGQEFVLPESIRPFNPNRLCSVETLMRSYCSEERNIRLQVGAQDTHLTWVWKYAAVSPI